MFFRGSRYEPVPNAEVATADGRIVRYKRRRVIPDLRTSLATTVRNGDRPDLLAYRALGDPELFWMLCDANRTRQPAELTRTPGRVVAVPGPPTGGA
jgi:hypothetical protein